MSGDDNRAWVGGPTPEGANTFGDLPPQVFNVSIVSLAIGKWRIAIARTAGYKLRRSQNRLKGNRPMQKNIMAGKMHINASLVSAMNQFGPEGDQ